VTYPIRPSTDIEATVFWAFRGQDLVREWPLFGDPCLWLLLHALREDEGVILSVTLGANTRMSFLFVLASTSFDELAKARLPHHIRSGCIVSISRAR
jgi:Retinal pigment epithelial membrane protein